MKKKFMTILIGSMILLPTSVAAQTNGGGPGIGNYPDIPRIPARSPSAYIAYNDGLNIATVCFRTTVEGAEIVLYKNGVGVESISGNAEAGTQIPLYLPAYGSGEFTIYVKRGTTLLAVYNITL